ncbi:MAG: HEPN domain-containing protein [Deltaproteobacteria bacterium]|nr:HEPN domain-containing protein [Deltaproteobacteria bacterium]
MKLKSLAEDYLRKAKARRKALEVLHTERSFDDVVREAQEIVELCLKGALRTIGVDPPKKHDVANLLIRFQDRLPVKWRDRLGEIESFSKRLFEERGHAFYGDESSLIPAAELFTDDDASFAIESVDESIAFLIDLLASKTK